MHKRRHTLPLLILLPALGGALGARHAGRVAPPPANRLETLLLADSADGRLDRFSLFEAALIAGGVPNERALAKHRRQFRSVVRRTRPAALAATSGPDRARAVLQSMHRHVLTGRYESDCSELSAALQEGCYNCLTATILYQCLCRRFDLPATAVAAPAHVFSRLQLEEPLEIETTYPLVLEAPLDSTADGRPRRAPRQAGPTAHNTRPLSPVQLVAKVYYNRGVARLGRERFREAVAALETSVQLDPDDEMARENLLAAINNWALAHCEAGRFREASDLLAYGRQLAPDCPALQANDLHIHQKWAVHLCEQQRYAEALRILEDGCRRRPRAELFDAGRFAVYRAWLQSLLDEDETDEAFALLSTACRRHPSRREVLELEADVIVRRAAQLQEQGKHAEALRLLARGRALHPNRQPLRDAHQNRKNLTHPRPES
jgi:tetratricopeptide (TPR) repeat protein